MAKVIPSLIQDETGRNTRANVAAQEALTRLYMSLMARRAEQERNEAMRMQMMQMQQAHQIGMQERGHQQRLDYADYVQGGGTGGTTGPNLFGPGAGGVPTPSAAAPTTTAAPKKPVFSPNMIPGSVAPLTPGDQFKGTTTQTPIGPNPDKFSARVGDDTEAFSAQARAPQPGKSGVNVQSPLPKPTTRRPQPARGDAYLPIEKPWLDYMYAKEQEYGLPRGVLLTLYGIENGGGRVTGKNPKSSATGLFQFTQELRREHGISDQDTVNPSIMIDRAAANLQRNHEVLRTKFGIQLPNTPDSIPLWTVLHQFGSGNGPRIIKALQDNSDTPMAQVMIPSKNNYQTLVNNGIDPMVSVKNFLAGHAQKARNWFHAGIQQFDNPNRPQGEQQQPQQDQQRNVPVGPFTAIRKGVDVNNITPPTQRFINEITALYPQIRVTSGYRSPQYNRSVGGAERSQHIQGTAFDMSLTGLSDQEKSDVIARARARGAKGIGNYGGDSVHIDFRSGPNAAWGPNRSNTSVGATPPWFRQHAQAHLAGQPPQPVAERPQQVSMQTPAPTPQMPAGVQAQAQAQAQAPDASTVAATLPSRAGGVIGNTAAFEKQYGVPKQPSIAPLDMLSPTLAAQQSFTQQQPPSQQPQPSTLSARSDIDYNAQPDVAAPITPQASGVAARSDLDYGTQAPTEVPLPPERPTIQRQPPPSEDYDLRDDMQTEFTVADRGVGGGDVDAAIDQALADLRGDINTRNFPTLPTPGVVAKQELPPELTPPARPIEWPPAGPAAPTAVARMPVPQEFATVDRGQRPSTPSAQDVSATAAPVTAPIPGQSIVNAIYSRLPNMGTTQDQTDKGTPPQLPNMPPPSALMPTLPPIPPGLSLEGVGAWLKQNFGPQGMPPAQQEFNTKLQGAVQQKIGDIRGAVGGFDPMAFIERLRYGPKSVKTERIGTPQPTAPQKAPTRMMPGGTPYITEQPPLQLLPKKGGPTNTTLSAQPSGAAAVPLPGTSGKPAVGKPVQRIMGPDGTPIFVVPNDTQVEEVPAEQ